MTLSEVLALAATVASDPAHDEGILARYLLDNLGEAEPCGYEQPSTSHDGDGNPTVVIPEWHGSVDPQDARAMAAMLLRAADRAEEDGHAKT